MGRHLRLRFRLFRRWLRTFIIHRVLHADDPPQRLALGIAIGVFVAITPTVGFQMLLVVFLAWALRANKAVGLPIVWITNPATIVPIYYPCYLIGRWILGQPPKSLRWWAELARPPEGWWDGVVFYWDRLTQIAVPLWLGCLLVGIVLGYISFRVSYSVIYAYRMKRWGQLTPPPAKARTHENSESRLRVTGGETEVTGSGSREPRCGMRDPSCEMRVAGSELRDAGQTHPELLPRQSASELRFHEPASTVVHNPLIPPPASRIP